MKRFLILLTALGLIAGSVATAEAKRGQKSRTERTVQGSYATQFVPFSLQCYQHGGVGCVEIVTRMDEAFLTAKVVDAHGQPVLASVWSWPDGHQPSDHYGSFCGETDELIAFDRGVDIYVMVGGSTHHDLPTPGASCSPGFGTTGTVSVTLSNLP
jgi:hypothetical protein